MTMQKGMNASPDHGPALHLCELLRRISDAVAANDIDRLENSIQIVVENTELMTFGPQWDAAARCAIERETALLTEVLQRSSRTISALLAIRASAESLYSVPAISRR